METDVIEIDVHGFKMKIPLYPCPKADCNRRVKDPNMYCCTPCNMADGNGPTGEVHEIHEHSEFCDTNAQVRGTQW